MPFSFLSSKLETLGLFSVFHSLSSCTLTLQPFWVPPFVATVRLFMLPYTSLVWHASFPTLASLPLNSSLPLETITVCFLHMVLGSLLCDGSSLIISPMALGTTHSEVSESAFLCSHSSAIVSSPAKLSVPSSSHSDQPSPLCCELHIWRGKMHPFWLFQYHSYPQTNIATICHIPETQVFA